MKVHLVVPCYRESARIGGFLPHLCVEMQRLGGVTVTVVEDGSGAKEQDEMRRIVTALSSQYDCLGEPLMLDRNLGKGGAVYAGWAQAGDADWLGFVDADGACSAREVARLILLARASEGGAQAFFASRVKMLGRQVNRLFKRHLLGRIYATLVSEALDIAVYDSQCGLKLLPKAAYEKIAPSLKIHGFAFDVELMAALLDSGCEVVEVPIDWHEVEGGKVSLVRDSWRMARDVWNIRSHRRKEKI